MTVEHIAMVLAAGGLDGSEKLQLVALANRTDEHGYCWPSIERQAEDTGTSISTTRRTLRRLEQKNLVKSMARYDSTGRQIQNLYRLNLALLASMRRAPRDYNDNVVEQITFDAPPAPPGEGVNLTGGGGQSDTPGGVNLTPKPSEEPSEEPSSSYAPAVVPAQRAAKEEEETRTEPSHRNTAEQLVDELPPVGADKRQPNTSLRQYLITGVAARLAAGWTTQQLQNALTADLGGAVSPGVYRHRLDLLPDTPPATPSTPTAASPVRQTLAWCGRCGTEWGDDRARRNVRFRLVDGQPCPDCHPDAHQPSQTAVDAVIADHPQSTTDTTVSDVDSGLQRVLAHTIR